MHLSIVSYVLASTIHGQEQDPHRKEQKEHEWKEHASEAIAAGAGMLAAHERHEKKEVEREMKRREEEEEGGKKHHGLFGKF